LIPAILYSFNRAVTYFSKTEAAVISDCPSKPPPTIDSSVWSQGVLRSFVTGSFRERFRSGCAVGEFPFQPNASNRTWDRVKRSGQKRSPKPSLAVVCSVVAVRIYRVDPQVPVVVHPVIALSSPNNRLELESPVARLTVRIQAIH